MNFRNLYVLFISLLMVVNLSAGLSLDSDQVTDYVEDETKELNSDVRDNVEESTDRIENITEDAEDEVLETKEVSGVLIPTIETLSDRIAEIRDQIPAETPGNSYLLLSNEGTYLIFTSEVYEVGEYSVNGNKFPSIELNEESYATIIADEVERKEPEDLEARELEQSIEDYRYEEVRVSGTLREVSFTPESQLKVSSPISLGVISSMSPLDENIAKNMRGRVEEMARNPKWNTFQEELGVDESRVPVIDLNDRYWSNTDADVTGVIVAPEDVLKIKEAVGPEGEEIIKQLKSNGAIYVDKVDYNPDKETIKDIHNDPAGENVRFNGLGAFKAVSMQESLSAGGVPIPADVNLQAGWMWDSENPEENILVLGASAKGTLASSKAVSGGKYEITGKTVSAQTIDSSLSKSRKIIVINDLERKTEINDILSDYPEIKGKEEILESIIKGEDIETLERRQKSSSEALNSDLSEEKEGKRDLKDEETYQKPKDKKDGELAQNKDVKEEPSSTKLSNNSSKKSDKKENSINEVFNTISRLLGF